MTVGYVPSTEELAYFAGILDGEGTICIYPRAHGRRGHDVYVAVYNTSYDLLQWIHIRFGGNIHLDERNSRLGKGTRFGTLPIGKVIWNSRPRIAELLHILLPYLVVKKGLAEIAIDFCQVPSWDAPLQEAFYSMAKERQNLAKVDGRHSDILVSLGGYLPSLS